MARILVAGFCAVPGPHRAGVQLPHVLRALSQRHTVEVLIVRKGDQAYVEQYRKTRLLRVPVPDGSVVKQIEAFRRALRRQLEGAEYDIVHFRDGWSGLPALELRERLKLRTVFDVARGPMAQAPPADDALARQLAREEAACIRAADLVLAPTEAAARFLSAKGGGDRVRIVPPGVDVDTFDWEHAAGLGPARILYAGLLRRGRGIGMLLRAMVEVASRTDARLALVGPVEQSFADELHGDIDKFGLGPRIDLLGAVDNEDMPSVIAGATICVAPLALELARQPTALYPTKLLEYMACRRVCVAPRRGTVTMLVTDNEHGLLFKPDDATDLAAQILRLLADPQLRDRLARAGYSRVRQGHTASGTRRELMVAYDPLVADLPETTDTGPAIPFGRVHERDGDETQEVTNSQLAVAGEMSGEVAARPSDTDADMLFSGPTVITTGADELTNVEVKPAAAGDSDDAVEISKDQAWLVEQNPLAEEDTGGTPVDLERAPTGPAVVQSRFAAGELEVPSPSDDGTPTPVIDPDDDMFEAAGALLGSEPEPKDTGETLAVPEPE